MSIDPAAPAVAIARAHVQAWSQHDFDTARSHLADDVRVTVTSTQPTMPSTNTTGIDDYMRGLIPFAQGVIPGSAEVIASVGDERNALLVVTVKADLGAGQVTLPAARLYLLNGNDKIEAEQVIVYTTPD
jgi:hypothetical protein